MYLYIDAASDDLASESAFAPRAAASRRQVLHDFLAVAGFAATGLTAALAMAFGFPAALELTPLLILFS